jgi:chaperone required for assembly of F1-ATPase
MSNWALKRFWKTATAVPVPGGFTVHLDARTLKTPGKLPFVLPTLALAEACAAEWAAQDGLVKPGQMPMTRFANSAIEKVTPQFDAVVAEVARYGETDHLCYRTENPPPLIARQQAGWDPILAWSSQTFGAPLMVTAGVVPVPQPPSSLAALRAVVAAQSPFQLAALHDVVAISGSLVLGLAVIRGRLTDQEAFDLSRIDEHWQAELWGQDEEAAEAESVKRADLASAARFFRYCG